MRPHPTDARSSGFSLIEVMVTVAVIGLAVAVIAPNLAGRVPEARLDGSAKALQTKLVMMRSEARIQAKRMGIELDLDRALFRLLMPPEDRLTSDQEILTDADLTERDKNWLELETGVRLAGAGDAANRLAEKGTYQIEFDEYGFTADQYIVLGIESDPELVWTLTIHGLTGKVEVLRSRDGEIQEPQYVEEGNF